MMQASNIGVSLDALLPENDALLRREVARALGVKAGAVEEVRLLKRSIDARKKANVHGVVTVAVRLANGAKLRPAKGVAVKPYEPAPPLHIPRMAPSDEALRPVVVGAGPAGLFCALYLARAGLEPMVVERGASVDERVGIVQAFNAGAPLDVRTNIQFGEGGAGTFSDGKLNTGIKSPHIRQVLETFVQAGAPEDILVDAKPHIGTDLLVGVVRNLRQAIQEAGGQVRFLTRLDGIQVENSRVTAAMLVDERTGETEVVPTNCVVLACGHSARDTFQMLRETGAGLERKPFAVGVRIEHPQAWVNEAQYGAAANHPALGAADYKLAVKCADGRGVYTFCMCPGGEVVAAASEEGGLCVNGMSRHARDGANANSALLVEVRPDDLPGNDPLEGVRFQRQLERAAYALGCGAPAAEGAGDCGASAAEGDESDASPGGTRPPYTAPAQTVGAFLAGASGCVGGLAADTGAAPSASAAAVTPTYPRGVAWCDLRACLPPVVADALAEALPLLDRKLHGFARPDAVMTAVEARSSSPVRIVRDGDFQSNIAGLYPCGEGAGYAGGITSAAVDGLRVAEAIVAQHASAAEGAGANALSTCDPHRVKVMLGGGEEEPALSLDEAAQALSEGRAVVLPTDTVYGVGVAVRAAESPQALFAAKGRPGNKPVAWLVGDAADLDVYGRDVPAYAQALARAFWPGALTLVVNASEAVPRAFQSEAGTIGLRMPASRAALELIRVVGSPLAVTSANLSGQPAPATAEDVDPSLLAVTAGIYLPPMSACDAKDEGADGTASTVIDCTGKAPRVLRPGALSLDDLKGCLP